MTGTPVPEWDEWAEELSRQASLAARAVRSGFVLYPAEDLYWRDDLTPGTRWLLDDIHCGGYESFADLDEVEEHLAADEELNGTAAEEDDEVFSVSMVWRDGRWTSLR